MPGVSSPPGDSPVAVRRSLVEMRVGAGLAARRGGLRRTVARDRWRGGRLRSHFRVLRPGTGVGSAAGEGRWSLAGFAVPPHLGTGPLPRALPGLTCTTRPPVRAEGAFVALCGNAEPSWSGRRPGRGVEVASCWAAEADGCLRACDAEPAVALLERDHLVPCCLPRLDSTSMYLLRYAPAEYSPRGSQSRGLFDLGGPAEWVRGTHGVLAWHSYGGARCPGAVGRPFPSEAREHRGGVHPRPFCETQTGGRKVRPYVWFSAYPRSSVLVLGEGLFSRRGSRWTKR